MARIIVFLVAFMFILSPAYAGWLNNVVKDAAERIGGKAVNEGRTKLTTVPRAKKIPINPEMNVMNLCPCRAQIMKGRGSRRGAQAPMKALTSYPRKMFTASMILSQAIKRYSSMILVIRT